MSLLPPSFIDSVVAIGNPNAGKETTWLASGFLFGSLEPQPENGWDSEGPKYSLWLVTNRHVSTQLKDTIIRFDASNSGNAIEILLNDFKLTKDWVHHPDPTVDISVIPLNVDKLRAFNAKLSFFTEDISSATLSKLKELGVHEGNGGFILGFPLGKVEGPTGSVIARRASIARIRNAYENNSKNILVDGTVYPGNSGGPAIIHPEPIVIQGTSPIQNAYLIGVVASYVPYRDVAISPQTGNTRVIFEENTGLTNVIAVDCLIETISFAKNLFN
jgi:hypothetical protein